MQKEQDYKKIGFYAVFILVAYFFYLLIRPFGTYLALGIALAIAGSPIYNWLVAKTNMKKTSSLVTVLIILLIIVIPSVILLSALVKETFIVFTQIDPNTLTQITNRLTEFTGEENKIGEYVSNFVLSAGEYAINWTLTFISSISQAVIGLLIMFSILYYSFLDGESWSKKLKSFMPFKEEEREHLLSQIKQITKSVLYGEVLISIIQGILGGLIFYLIGISNPIFWGFIISVLAFLPIVGSGLVWVPAAIIKIMNGDAVAGIFLLTYGVIVIGGVDYLVRPKIISKGSRIHPMTALIGAFGGIQLFGFTGLLLGPLIAAIFETIIQFHYDNYVKKNKTRK